MFLFTLSSFADISNDKKPGKATDKEQKKEEYKVSVTIRSVKSKLKEQKYSNVNEEINNAMKAHPEARSSVRLHVMQAQALQNLILEENKKMYLKQNADTAKYFRYIYSLYETALRCDSLEQIPNEKGKVLLDNRYSNQQKLMQFRKNLASADRFFSLKKDYKNAFRFADMYLLSKKKPIFTTARGEYLLESEKDSVMHASLATFLAYAENNFSGAIKYIEIAKNDTNRLAQILEVGAKAFYAEGDTLTGNQYLYEGVEKFPTNEYFFLTLIKYYNENGHFDAALELCDSVITRVPSNRNYWFLKAKQHENLTQYDAALAALHKIVELQQDDYESYAAIGNINLDRAQTEYRKFNLNVTDENYASGRLAISKYYRKAMEAYEKCRKLAEDKPSLWLSGLRECYYKLNMGKELKALDKVR